MYNLSAYPYTHDTITTITVINIFITSKTFIVPVLFLCFCLHDSMDMNLSELQETVKNREALVCCTSRGHKESDTT